MSEYDQPIMSGCYRVPSRNEIAGILITFRRDLAAERVFTDEEIEAVRQQLVLFGPLTVPKDVTYPDFAFHRPFLALRELLAHMAAETSIRDQLCDDGKVYSRNPDKISEVIAIVDEALTNLNETDYPSPR